MAESSTRCPAPSQPRRRRHDHTVPGQASAAGIKKYPETDALEKTNESPPRPATGALTINGRLKQASKERFPGSDPPLRPDWIRESQMRLMSQ